MAGTTAEGPLDVVGARAATRVVAASWRARCTYRVAGSANPTNASRPTTAAEASQNRRFGMAPLFLRHMDTWDAVEHLRDIMETRSWDRPEFHTRAAVT